MRLALIFDKTRPDTTGLYFEAAAEALGLPYDHWWLRDAGRIRSGYDLYLRIDHGDDYLRPLPDGLRPAAFYAIDTHLAHSWRKIRRSAGWYDLIFCAHREGAERLAGAVWLPLACDARRHGHGEGGLREWDVAFVGNDGGVPRKFYLQALRERYPNSFIGTADHRQLGAIYGRARIGFNYAIADDVNMRFFEVMAAGALLVTNALKGDDLERLGFHDREQLLVYRSPAELFALIDEFLSRPNEREAVAQAGARLVRERHTYAHRLARLLTVVSERLGLEDFVTPVRLAPGYE